MGGNPPLRPRPGAARVFAYDTMTLVGPGTWKAARAAVDVALTAVDLVTDAERVAYACCRPPGHHVTRSLYGGSCYLNNTAVAATELLRRVGGPVAVVDIDAHHGNGTQELFLDRPDVLTASVHVDPGAGWFPTSSASRRERRREPQPPHRSGYRDDGWLSAVRERSGFRRPSTCSRHRASRRCGGRRPREPARGERCGYHEGGRILGGLGLPTVVVQEGGYDLATIGELVVGPWPVWENGAMNRFRTRHDRHRRVRSSYDMRSEVERRVSGRRATATA